MRVRKALLTVEHVLEEKNFSLDSNRFIFRLLLLYTILQNKFIRYIYSILH